MRQFAKVVIFIAPVLLASSGCATKPSFLTKNRNRQSSQQVATNRTERLLNVAKKYEEEGKPDVAERLYEHIVSQDPKCVVAKERIAALNSKAASADDIRMASKSVKSTQRLFPPSSQPAEKSKPRTAEDLLAAMEQSSTTSDRIAEIDRKQVNQIELSYEKPKPGLAKTASAKIAKQSRTPEWSKTTPSEANTQSGSGPVAKLLEPKFDLAPEERIARPLEEYNSLPVLASTGQEPVSIPQGEASSDASEWWEAEMKQPIATIAQKAVDLGAPAVAVENNEIARPLPSEPVATPQATRSLETLLAQSQAEKAAASLQNLCTAEASPELIQLVAMLDSEQAEQRIAGLIELGTQGAEAGPASPAVRVLLNDRHALVRAHAAGTIRDIEGGQADVIEHLIELVQEKDQGVVRLASYLLGQMGADAESAVVELRQIRDQENGLTSLHAAEALTRILPEESGSYEVLERALFSQNRENRLFAAVSLGGVYPEGEAFAARALKDALRSKDADVRASAALSLGGLGKHAEIALDELKRASDYDTPEVREAALTALACLIQ